MSIRIARRSANYSKQELDSLLTYLEENPDLVSVKLGGQYQTPNDIRLAWDDLAEKITAVGGYFGTRRSGQEVKRKWSDLKSRVKAKAASLAIEGDRPDGGNPNLKLTPMDVRVLAILGRDKEDQSHNESSNRGIRIPSVKVFSFNTESNSGDGPDFEFAESGGQPEDLNETGILEEIKMGDNEDKRKRISEAFSADRRSMSFKRARVLTEEEQLQELCYSQQELISEMRSMKDIMKKCQLSIEKIALLKRAELRLKCAKYGVDFEDLFD